MKHLKSESIGSSPTRLPNHGSPPTTLAPVTITFCLLFWTLSGFKAFHILGAVVCTTSDPLSSQGNSPSTHYRPTGFRGLVLPTPWASGGLWAAAGPPENDTSTGEAGVPGGSRTNPDRIIGALIQPSLKWNQPLDFLLTYRKLPPVFLVLSWRSRLCYSPCLE